LEQHVRGKLLIQLPSKIMIFLYFSCRLTRRNFRGKTEER